MGQPSIKTKQAKHKRQKKKLCKCGPSKMIIPEVGSTTASCTPSSLLFSDPPSLASSNDDVHQYSSSTYDHHITERNHDPCAIGDADADLIEMELYDMYRHEDGEPHSYEL